MNIEKEEVDLWKKISDIIPDETHGYTVIKACVLLIAECMASHYKKGKVSITQVRQSLVSIIMDIESIIVDFTDWSKQNKG